MPSQKELDQLDRSQQLELDRHLEQFEEEEGDEEAAINAYYDDGDARMEDERDRYRDEEDT